jgi:hypothetical protein
MALFRFLYGKVTLGVIKTVPLADSVTPGLRAKPHLKVPVALDHTP